MGVEVALNPLLEQNIKPTNRGQFYALFGSRWGRHHWGCESAKTVEGSAAFLASILTSGLLLARTGLLHIPSWTCFRKDWRQ